MNFVDILLIIATFITLIIGIGISIGFIIDTDYVEGVICIGITLFIAGCCAFPFFVLDKHSGSTMGTITSVDKNFFGTTALYVKTTETNEEEYCIEFDKKLEKKAKKLIGKKVKISYGKRIGFYSTGKCGQAPINNIEEIK